jgi:tight adherence protein D
MTLESRHAINFRELPSADKNKRIFELQNVRLGHALLRAADDITREYPDINKLTFYQNQTDAVLIEFEFTHSLAKAKVFRLASGKAPGNDWCLIFITAEPPGLFLYGNKHYENL